MLTLVLIAAVIGVMVVAAIATAAFLRTAFTTQEELAAETRARVAWRPSFIQGEQLEEWAAGAANRAAVGALAAGRNATTAARVVDAVAAGATPAMLPLARPAEAERVIPCPEAGQGTIGVTAPEILQIAEHLRQTCSRRDLECIRARALAAATGPVISSPVTPASCALQGDDSVCCAYHARPLRCRPLHAMAIAHSMGERRADPGEQAAAGEYERTIARGLEDGLKRALRSAHLDSTVYELNSALAVALGTPDAAVRWAQGENVFASCATPTAPNHRVTWSEASRT
jgi:hypothetical protein